MAVWPQTVRKKILAKFKFGGGVLAAYYVIINVANASRSASRLRYLNKTVSSHIYKKYNWQRVSDKLAQLVKKGTGRGQERYSMYSYTLRGIILVDFNLMVSTLTAKPPYLNPCQIFRLYSS